MRLHSRIFFFSHYQSSGWKFLVFFIVCTVLLSACHPTIRARRLGDASIQRNQIGMDYGRTGHCQEAIKEFDEALLLINKAQAVCSPPQCVIEDQNIINDLKAEIYYNRAYSYLMLNPRQPQNIDRAIDDARAAIRFSMLAHPQATYTLGYACLLKGDAACAREQLYQLKTRFPQGREDLTKELSKKLESEYEQRFGAPPK